MTSSRLTARPRAVRGASLSLEQRVYRRAELLVAGEVTIGLRRSARPAAPSHPRGHACYTARRSRRPRRIALDEQLSLIDLVLNAGPTVKLVMALLLASVASWFMIVQRFLYFRSAHAEMLDFEEHFWSGVELAQLYREGNEREADGEHIIGMEGLFRAGFKEFSRLAKQTDIQAEALLEGARRAMRVAMLREEERLEKHLPFLATVGSTSPYIGLFGTVWGIMHSFRGLANTSQATLATVAPGISEALVATAMGLFAAIPAVMAYNRFRRACRRFRQALRHLRRRILEHSRAPGLRAARAGAPGRER
jgi:biopolymer transport protein TolQ